MVRHFNRKTFRSRSAAPTNMNEIFGKNMRKHDIKKKMKNIISLGSYETCPFSIKLITIGRIPSVIADNIATRKTQLLFLSEYSKISLAVVNPLYPYLICSSVTFLFPPIFHLLAWSISYYLILYFGF